MIDSICKNFAKKLKEIREKKTNKFKDFPLSKNTISAIKEYLNSRDYNENEPLFISRKNKGFLLRQQAYKIINDVAKRIGIKEKIGTHTLKLLDTTHTIMVIILH